MRYMYNESYGVIIYPENWFDVIRSWITRIIHPSFRRTWSWWAFNKPTLGCIEHKLEITTYPDEATGG